ncbi:MAG: nucleotidyltransferase domain-containing protein [Clostridiales bacterium]|nr:nucleotidyltransferase domain-containing protein [Clostridiales bacterium]
MAEYSEVFQKLVPELVHIFGSSVDSIILYGSVARGTQTEESDIDIAVILDSYTEDMHERMTDFIVDLELEHDVVLSVRLINFDKFKKWENVMPYYKNVKKDGIVLWKAA